MHISQTGVNRVILIGNAGENAELRFTSSGKPVAHFSVALNESFKNGNGEKVERVEWFRCVAWNWLAEVCGQYLTRGTQVFLEGRLQTRKYDHDGAAKALPEPDAPPFSCRIRVRSKDSFVKDTTSVLVKSPVAPITPACANLGCRFR
jgi:Single-strand binding protein family